MRHLIIARIENELLAFAQVGQVGQPEIKKVAMRISDHKELIRLGEWLNADKNDLASRDLPTAKELLEYMSVYRGSQELYYLTRDSCQNHFTDCANCVQIRINSFEVRQVLEGVSKSFGLA